MAVLKTPWHLCHSSAQQTQRCSSAHTHPAAQPHSIAPHGPTPTPLSSPVSRHACHMAICIWVQLGVLLPGQCHPQGGIVSLHRCACRQAALPTASDWQSRQQLQPRRQLLLQEPATPINTTSSRIGCIIHATIIPTCGQKHQHNRRMHALQCVRRARSAGSSSSTGAARGCHTHLQPSSPFLCAPTPPPRATTSLEGDVPRTGPGETKDPKDLNSGSQTSQASACRSGPVEGAVVFLERRRLAPLGQLLLQLPRRRLQAGSHVRAKP